MPTFIVTIRSLVSRGSFRRAKGSELSLSRNIFLEILIRRENGSPTGGKSHRGPCNAAGI